MKTLLIIGYTLPEPSTTAAGSRLLQLIYLFKEAGYTITFSSTATQGAHSLDFSTLGINYQPITLNDDSFDVFVRELHPTIVLFDRYLTEEQFGWRVATQCPNALRILDTEDLHFLRKARYDAFKKGEPFAKANVYTDLAKRELASILRSDLSLIISEVEMQLLQETFKIPKAIILYLPFLIDTNSIPKTPSFNERTGFMCIGNFLHKPNEDAVLFLKQEIWPQIKKELPKAVIHIYGAYAKQHILQLHNKKAGFLVEGWTPSVSEVMQSAKVNLAPLRFGAGLKGKIFDAMRHGLPTVTTSIGAEGINGALPFSGVIEDETSAFVKASVALYTNEKKWLQASHNGTDILHKRFAKTHFTSSFFKTVNVVSKSLQNHRNQNFTGRILHHHTLQSTKYLSKWIALKNRIEEK